MFTINGVELEYDAFDVATAGRYKLCRNHVSKEVDRAKEFEIPESLDIMCNAVRKGFDVLFGDGTSEKVFGDGNNIRTATEAFNALLEEDERQGKDFAKNGNVKTLAALAKKNK